MLFCIGFGGVNAQTSNQGLSDKNKVTMEKNNAKVSAILKAVELYAEAGRKASREIGQQAFTEQATMSWVENGKIKTDTRAPGLQEARKKLLYMNMSEKERRVYEHHIENQMVENDVLDTARIEGHAEGLAQGLAEGKAEGRAEGLAQGKAEGLAQGKVEGRAEGLAQGLAQGVTEGVAQVARSMKQLGIPYETIAQATHLSISEIEAL